MDSEGGLAALRFIVTEEAFVEFAGLPKQRRICAAKGCQGTGPARERLGCPQDSATASQSSRRSRSAKLKQQRVQRQRGRQAWDPQLGLDLFWEGESWTSTLISAPARTELSFCLVQVLQRHSHPGLLIGSRRAKVHGQRKFLWCRRHTVRMPGPGQVLEVLFDSGKQLRAGAGFHLQHKPRTRILQRKHLQPFGEMPLKAGHIRCHTFDAPQGLEIDFALYMPPDYTEGSTKQWPLLLFLHSMYCSFSSDNSMFFEADSPPRILLGDRRFSCGDCPEVLRKNFIVLMPQCPVDKERDEGIWLRHGWYSPDSWYATEVEEGLSALTQAVVNSFNVDKKRISITGTSMGGYAALELAARWSGCFSAVVPVAAHYDIDPLGPLVTHLGKKQAVPLWFFHARNDWTCPFKTITKLVSMLQRASRAEVRLTSYKDTWSTTGHCSDRVAYWTAAERGQFRSFGDALFSWLLKQR
eukprot:CAMPEP_0178371982 /NCGR_PEP_ID=MMETSP0689_2-20121128/1110_1 /TAXON_ID=160604 /ORGANISM="Amphidinium massartii, Strain CS-259" /LENGTH=468 /DNA_ID=CAMNT_0019991875 /DNA_START=27 /DNA_END=1429 /DNA_ORIENTATION=+